MLSLAAFLVIEDAVVAVIITLYTSLTRTSGTWLTVKCDLCVEFFKPPFLYQNISCLLLNIAAKLAMLNLNITVLNYSHRTNIHSVS